MKGQQLGRGRVLRRAAHLTAASLAIVGFGVVGGCLTRPLQQEDTRTTSTYVTRLTESAVDKIDLLLMIDNSRSMADKQQVLVQAIPDLVNGLVNPKCVDEAEPNNQALWVTVPGPKDPCPTGTKRDFTPVLDIHIGIVTSSIGGHGSDSCPNDDTNSGACPSGVVNRTNNDMGHLVARLDACTQQDGPTYDGKGFLAWDPDQKYNPPGEVNVGAIDPLQPDGTVPTKSPGIVPSLKDLVLGTGQVGCGFEAQLEGWYRFLIDPTPYKSVTINEKGQAVPQDLDDVLLQQRRDFLRPSSLLAIIGLSDENDCSTKEYGQFYLVNQQAQPGNPNQYFHLPKARTECATNPNDKCCVSCGQAKPEGCPDDPNCGNTTDKTDPLNLRCWDTKRRFGIDFLYPIDRYVTGLTQSKVPDRSGELVDNPIFTVLDANSKDTNVRDASLVFLAYIVGVPWQDIARVNANGVPDLNGGLDPKGNPVGGFMSATELATTDKDGHTRWDYIIGDPDSYKEPLDPHMIQDNKPRSGTNPITGDTIAPPAQAEGGPDKLNGHEYTPGTVNGTQVTADDLEYACIFKLQNPRDCSGGGLISCDCQDGKNDNPLCTDNGASGRTLQTHAKGYPGIRELTLVKNLGTQGIVGSICPAQLDNSAASARDFGYRPAIGAIIDRLKVALGGQCLPRKLSPDPNGQVSCLILEGQSTGGTHAKDCDVYCDGLVARQRVDDAHKIAVQAAKDQSPNSNLDCFCEIKQLMGKSDDTMSSCTDTSTLTSELKACQCVSATTAPTFDGKQVDGWCYVDATTVPPVGNSKIVENCPDSEKRLVRFVGGGNPLPGSMLFITCTGE